MDMILSFVRDAALVTIKVLMKALAQYLFKLLFKRRKDRTAPTANRDGSGN